MFVALSSGGMTMLALTPNAAPGQSVGVKLLGVVLASLSSGAGELSFLGLTHYYGQMSLAAWSSGTGGAGLAGAGLYVMLTTWLGFGVPHTLLASAFLPVVMLISFFVILPQEPLRQAHSTKGYQDVPTNVPEEEEEIPGPLASGLVRPAHSPRRLSEQRDSSKFTTNLRRARALFLPYMLPLLLVYVAEYTINQGVAPTLLFPLVGTPFSNFRSFYPFYSFLYQLGVFISRSSSPFIRIRSLYIPSILQVVNLFLLTAHAVWNFIPNVYIIFAIIFWEGLLGGAVYVNTFASILEDVDPKDREFSLGATSVSDSGGICIAGFLGMTLEVLLCNWQVYHGRKFCKML